MKGLNNRRSYELKAKAKAKKIIKKRFLDSSREPTPEEIGKMASVHSADCSCPACGNPRKFFNELTIQERKQMKFLDGSELELD